MRHTHKLIDHRMGPVFGGGTDVPENEGKWTVNSARRLTKPADRQKPSRCTRAHLTA